MSILADIFMLLSCPGCHGIQCFKLFDINLKKKKVWQDIYLQLSYTECVLLYSIATYFSPRNRFIYRRKTKQDKNYMIGMLELFMDVENLIDVVN